MPRLLRGGQVFDGRKSIGQADILIDDEGRISKVGKRLSAPPKTEVTDLRGKFVMPGLIDAHLHFSGRKGGLGPSILLESRELRLLRAATDLRKLLDAGFTTVRDCGQANALPLKAAVEKGILKGPRIQAAGRALSPTFGHADIHYLPPETVHIIGLSIICDGVDECRKATRTVMREGADFIKTMASGGVMSQRDKIEWPNFSPEELVVIVQEAARFDTYVAAHAHSDRGARAAVLAGVRTIEHGTLLSDETLKLMARKGTYLVPTLAVQFSLIENGKQAGVDSWALEKVVKAAESVKIVVPKARKLGIKVAAGTDYTGVSPGFEMGTNAKEIVLLNEIGGFTPTEALQAATSVAAETIGLADIIGTITEGKVADVVATRRDPIEDGPKVLTENKNILLVLKDGKTEVSKM